MMKKTILFISAIVLAFTACAQNGTLHYIKFVQVGEQIMPVHPLNISIGGGTVPRDSVELINDTLRAVSIVTDERSFNELSEFITYANFKIRRTGHKVEFGTFKVIADGRRFYVPDVSATKFFKKMVKTLKDKKADPQLISTIIDNYPWVFNP
jgi:hypothetical protein